MLWLLAALSMTAAAKAPPPPPPASAPGIFLYTARRDRNMEVVVDVNADRGLTGLASVVVIFLYARRVNGSDIMVENVAFDCAKGFAKVLQTGKESRRVEPLALKDVDEEPYAVPRPSLMASIGDVACLGPAAIPPAWTPNALNLRQIARAYYETYLGQKP